MNSRELWYGNSLAARLKRRHLQPTSAIYYLCWQIYLLIYKLGLKRAKEPHVPIVVIGNFTVGGTGKTPITIYVAQVLSELAHEVVIGCSGYGAPKSRSATLAPEGRLTPSEWGDEPALIRELLPDVPLIVGRDRVLAATICQSNFPNSVLLMDDGLQHLPLKTHIKIAVEPKQSSNRMVLPAGPYREPYNHTRVDIVVPGHFQVKRKLSHLKDQTGNRIKLPLPCSMKARALAAIGNPDQFFAALEKVGIELEVKIALNDHDPLTAGTLLTLFDNEIPTIVTLKDWVKLRDLPGISDCKIWIAHETISIEPKQDFTEWLHERLEITTKKILE
jgi:tetraacyldisaccharide 4'-kinase